MKTDKKAGIGVTAVVLFAVAVFMLAGNVYGVDVKLSDTAVTVSAMFFEESVNYSDVASAEIESNFNFDTRTMGTDFIGVISGSLQNSALGSYRGAAYKSQTSVIVIKTTDGKALVFNTKDEAQLNALLGEIKAHL